VEQGIFKPHPKGFGFIQDSQRRSVFVSPSLACNFFYLDTVGFRLEVDQYNRFSAHDLYLVEPGLRTIAGTVEQDSSGLWVVPEVSTLPRFEVYTNTTLVPQAGDKVVAKAFRAPRRWVMDVTSIIGNELTPFWESQLSVKLHNIPTEVLDFPVSTLDTIQYRDLRDLSFVTIDSEFTQDIDDAVFVREREGGNGWILYVAIADASSYVPEGSKLDSCAFERGTTVYFAHGSYPMLPHSISSQAGSLLPGLERRALVCEMIIGPSGVIEGVDVYGAIVQSHGRFSYEQVSEYVTNSLVGDSSMLFILHDLYLHLLEQRVMRCSTPIRSGDYKFEFDDKGRAVNIVYRPWHVAYGMIEECMLAANTSVASWLMQRNVPCLYRHHRGPDVNSLSSFASYFEQLGIGPFDTELSASDVQQAISIASQQGHAFSAANVFRSAMRPASYRVGQTQHHGLSYEYYTHFTSPLRRYADLTVHRCVKRILAGFENYSLSELELIAAKCTALDMRAKKAKVEEVKRLKAWYAQKLIGQKIEVSITGGNNAGFFVQSLDPPLDTFVVASNFGWTWDASRQCSTHAVHGVLSIGDKVFISIESVDMQRLRVAVLFDK